MSKVVFARASVAIGGSGNRLSLREGDMFWSDSLEVQAHPDLFSEDPDPRFVRGTRVAGGVEQATAAPGEQRRGVRRER